jgi:hypothetical protein
MWESYDNTAETVRLSGTRIVKKKSDIVCVTGLKTKQCFVSSMQMLPKLEQFMLVLPF